MARHASSPLGTAPMGDAEKNSKGGASKGPAFFPAATSAAMIALIAARTAASLVADPRLTQVRERARSPLKPIRTPCSMPSRMARANSGCAWA